MKPTPSNAPARLRVQGPDLIKPNGQPWVGRGVNFGSWGEDQPADCATVKAMHANVFRIPLRWKGLYGKVDPGTPPIDSFDADSPDLVRDANMQHWLGLIDAAIATGAWVGATIDSNCVQSGTQSPEDQAYCDPDNEFGEMGNNLLTNPELVAEYTAVWVAAAKELRKRERIAFLELLPEPLGGRGADVAGPLSDFHRGLMDAIGRGTPFLIGGFDGYAAENVDTAWLAERDDVIYTGNLLSQWVTNPDRFDKALAHLTNMRAQRNVPVFGQQVGRKSSDDVDGALMRLACEKLAAAGVGYTWWQWKQNTDQAGQYALNFKDGAGGWIPKQGEIDLLTEIWGG